MKMTKQVDTVVPEVQGMMNKEAVAGNVISTNNQDTRPARLRSFTFTKTRAIVGEVNLTTETYVPKKAEVNLTTEREISHQEPASSEA